MNAARRITAFSGSGCFTCGGRGTAAFGFDFKSRPITSTDALGRETTYAFDIYSNMTSRSVELEVLEKAKRIHKGSDQEILWL